MPSKKPDFELPEVFSSEEKERWNKIVKIAQSDTKNFLEAAIITFFASSSKSEALTDSARKTLIKELSSKLSKRYRSEAKPTILDLPNEKLVELFSMSQSNATALRDVVSLTEKFGISLTSEDVDEIRKYTVIKEVIEEDGDEEWEDDDSILENMLKR